MGEPTDCDEDLVADDLVNQAVFVGDAPGPEPGGLGMPGALVEIGAVAAVER